MQRLHGHRGITELTHRFDILMGRSTTQPLSRNPAPVADTSKVYGLEAPDSERISPTLPEDRRFPEATFRQVEVVSRTAHRGSLAQLGRSVQETHLLRRDVGRPRARWGLAGMMAGLAGFGVTQVASVQ